MGRKRKLFLGTEPIGGKDMKSRRKARFVTSQYHSIRNEMHAIDKDKDISSGDKKTMKKVLNDKLEAIGGVDKYQQASIISTSHFKTSRWVVTILEQLGRKKSLENGGQSPEVEAPSSSSGASKLAEVITSKTALPPPSPAATADIRTSSTAHGTSTGSTDASITNTASIGTTTATAATTATTTANTTRAPPNKLKTLEVGAINVQLQQCPWLSVRAIDVNSQHPSIEECDFFDIEPMGDYDAVVCSMVVNCVTEPVLRGEMLARLYAHLKPVTGVLFLVLPLRCINSRHIGGRFDPLLSGLGFTQLIEKRLTPRLVFYVLGRNIPGNVPGNIPQDSKNALVNASQEDSRNIQDDDSKNIRDAKRDKNRKRDDTSESKRCMKYDWLATVQSAIATHMKKNISDYFLKDCSGVPPVEFCLSIASVIEH